MKTTRANNPTPPPISQENSNGDLSKVKTKSKRAGRGMNKIKQKQSIERPGKHSMTLRATSIPMSRAIAPNPEIAKTDAKSHQVPQKELVAFVRSLGRDASSGRTFHSMMISAFRSATPYVIVQAHTTGDDCVFLDGQSFRKALLSFHSQDNTSFFDATFSVPVHKLVFFSIVPWKTDILQWATMDRNQAPNDLDNLDLLYLAGSEQASWPRGLAYARFCLGLGVLPDQKTADFLFSQASNGERLSSFDDALAYASTSMPPEIIRFLLEKGAQPAPCVGSDDFLPLTLAAKSGQLETVKLLLQAGADPRQAASFIHGTALSWAEGYPEIKAEMLKSLDGKDKDIILRPSLQQTWEAIPENPVEDSRP